MSSPPDWNAMGLLPPFRPAGDPAAGRASPYRVSLASLVDAFGGGDERRAILRGFLDFRAVLHAAGIVGGRQWIDGSFVEDVELREGRPPRDVDVVTLLDPAPASAEAQAAVRGLSMDGKAKHRVDAYFVSLGSSMNASTPDQLAYWNQLWSHTREGVWKGFVEVPLDPAEDAAAGRMLALAPGAEGAPA